MTWRRAPAKLNLSLRVLGRREDGYHDIESLVAFADVPDWLGFAPGPAFSLAVEGPGAGDAGPLDDNLVARAARALAARVPDLTTGAFRLVKRLPAAAGLGGGSSDAAACLRALAAANGLAPDDPRIMAAASDTGADVPVCVSAQARTMAGVGDRLGPTVAIPPLVAVLVNPREAVATRDVFRALGMPKGFRRDGASGAAGEPDRPGAPAAPPSITLEDLAALGNDLEAPALEVLPAIGDVLDRLRRLAGARLVRMSGSGATCFALFDEPRAAAAARAHIAAEEPGWWVAAGALR